MMQEKLIELLDLNLPLGDELSAIFYILGIVTYENSGPEKCTSFFFSCTEKYVCAHVVYAAVFCTTKLWIYTRVRSPCFL